MSWQRIELSGLAAELLIIQPERPLLLYLPHFDQAWPSAYPIWERACQQARLNCVVPLAGESWWTDRPVPHFHDAITPSQFVLEHLLPEAQKRCLATEQNLLVMGLGSGGHAALRMAFRSPNVFKGVYAWNATIDQHLYWELRPELQSIYKNRESCRQDSALFAIPQWGLATIYFGCELDSPNRKGNDRLHEKLNALGITHTYTDEPHPESIESLFQQMVQIPRSKRRLI
ncbi:MAG: hypothetical protein N2112_01770 [Gemmataceae bacterium]|jgi:enterochelin esterase-like enzyme|nr:hypothetical protein [Gemmataceae bacterium]